MQNNGSSLPPRRRVDLRKLPYGLGYIISIAVVVFVIALAWLSSRNKPAPAWWTHGASPIIYWTSPLLIVVLIAYYIRRSRRNR
jgi:hypothetical protein